MYDENYDNYIRSIFGYPTTNQNNEFNNYQMNQNFITNNTEIEGFYPEIYKTVYPLVQTRCKNLSGRISQDDVENLTDEILNMLKRGEETDININLNNTVRATEKTKDKIEKKPEVSIKASPIKENISVSTETRGFNDSLRDLVKILLIRELLSNCSNCGNQRPPRPPQRPPMYGPGQNNNQWQPPFGPGPNNNQWQPPFRTRSK